MKDVGSQFVAFSPARTAAVAAAAEYTPARIALCAQYMGLQMAVVVTVGSVTFTAGSYGEPNLHVTQCFGVGQFQRSAEDDFRKLHRQTALPGTNQSCEGGVDYWDHTAAHTAAGYEIQRAHLSICFPFNPKGPHSHSFLPL